MFGINFKPKSVAGPIRTISQEVKATGAKYNEYLKTTKNDYIAQRGDVQIYHPHAMAGDAYNTLKSALNILSKVAKKANKEVMFEDAKTLFPTIMEGSYTSPEAKKDFSSKILVTVTNKGNRFLNPKADFVDASPRAKEPLLKQVSNVLGEMITGQKGSNIDKELGLR